jgi:hypothetical protein
LIGRRRVELDTSCGNFGVGAIDVLNQKADVIDAGRITRQVKASSWVGHPSAGVEDEPTSCVCNHKASALILESLVETSFW